MKHAFFALASALLPFPPMPCPSILQIKGCVPFNDDGSLTVTGSYNGKELHYIIGEGEAERSQCRTEAGCPSRCNSIQKRS